MLAFVLLALVLAGTVSGIVGYGWMVAEYGGRAAAFDLEKLRKMESASLIYDRSGQLLGKIFIQNRIPIPFEQIPKRMVDAVVAEEDNRFFEHHGVDYMGVLRAAISNYRQGRVKQGASTVTQQLARNSFELRERSYQRKLLEMFLARRIEESLSKEKIMELYLNRVYFGSGFYGVEAAARGYFGKPAKDLTPGECAMLAGLLKSPNAHSPWNNPKLAKKDRDFVLTRMREMGFLNRQDYEMEMSLPLSVRKRTNPNKVSYAVDLVRQQAIAALGYDRAMNDGVRIETTFDIKMQQVAERALRSHLEFVEKKPGYTHPTLEQYRRSNEALEKAAQRGETVTLPAPGYLQGAVLAVENATGGILALAGGREFLHSEYNRAIQGRRPPGTLFTPMVAAAAYSKGIFPGETVDDACIDNHYVMIGGEGGILGEWGVERPDNDYEGPMPSAEAVSRGKNAAVVRLGFRTGLEKLAEICKAAGIRSPLRDVANAYLGSSEMTLDEMTLAYTAFAGDGTRPSKLFTITKITDPEGRVLYENTPERTPVLPAAVAAQVDSTLHDSLHKTCAREATALGISASDTTMSQLAGKSGTAYDFTDTWFVGYSTAVTCGVWVGFDKPQKIYRGAFGRDLALPVWADVIKASTGAFPPRPRMIPPDLKSVEICRESGLIPCEGCRKTARGEGMLGVFLATASEVPGTACDVHGNGVRNYTKGIDQADWPRAAAAVDLTRIRPIVVNSPTLLAQADAYRSVNPALQNSASNDDGVKVARATSPDGKDPGVEGTKAMPPAAPQPSGGSEMEVRRAEAVRPMDIPSEVPVMTLPAPKPAEF